MRKLLILPLLLLMSSCVHYYKADTAVVNGVYYAEDDPRFVPYYTGGGYPFYPWASLDYFYLGTRIYPGFAYSYGYAHGFRYGFSSAQFPYSFYGSQPFYVAFYNYPYASLTANNGGACMLYSDCRYLNHHRHPENLRDHSVGDAGRVAAGNNVERTRTIKRNREAGWMPADNSLRGNRNSRLSASPQSSRQAMSAPPAYRKVGRSSSLRRNDDK